MSQDRILVRAIPREWPAIIGVTLVATLIFFLLDAEIAATLGWLSMMSGLLLVGYIIYSGWKLRSEKTQDSLAYHRDHISVMTALILIGVAGIEVAVRKEGGVWGNKDLLAFHLSVVALMVAFFLLARFKDTGLINPRRHRMYAYSFIFAYAVAFVTGTALLLQHPRIPIGVPASVVVSHKVQT